MLSALMGEVAFADLTGYAGPVWARTGLARRCRCQPGAAKTVPRQAQGRKKTAQDLQMLSVCGRILSLIG